MEYETPKSKCGLCGSEFTGRGMTRHLKSCLKKYFEKKESKGKPQDLLFLHVADAYNPDYFLYLLLGEKTTLNELDGFLRGIWLECCGHMSAFSFERYGDDIDMRKKAVDVFELGNKVVYQYDFGSTTELTIKAMGHYYGSMDGKIQLISRNAQPIIPCDECCAKPAVRICTECGAGWLCEDCAKTHECGEEMFLPVVNSPRTGVCAYEG